MNAALFKCFAWIVATVANWAFMAAGRCRADGHVCACVGLCVIGVIFYFFFYRVLDEYVDAKSKEAK